MGELDTSALRKCLHDGLCQQLTGALMFARVLADTLEKRGDALSADGEALFRMIDAAANEVHTLMDAIGAAAAPAQKNSDAK